MPTWVFKKHRQLVTTTSGYITVIPIVAQAYMAYIDIVFKNKNEKHVYMCVCMYVLTILYSVWWFGTWLLFFHILGRIIPFDFPIFQRGSTTTPGLHAQSQ